MSRTWRSVASLLTGYGGTAVSMAVALFSTPLLLAWLGDARVGTHRVLIEWFGYLALLDFGLATTLQTAVARRLVVGERAGALADARYAMRRYAAVALLQAIAVGGLVVTGPALVTGLPEDLAGELRWGLGVTGIALLWTPLAALRPLLDGAQQSYWVNVALIGQSLGTVGASLLLAWAGCGLVGQCAAVAVGSGANALVLLVVVSRRYPELWQRQTVAVPDAFPVAWPMFVFNLIGRASVLSDSIILGLTRGAEDVVRFAVTQRLMLVAVTQVMALGNATWAALAELYHRGEMDTFRRRFLQLNRWTAVLGVATVGPLAVLNDRLVGVWVGSERFGGYDLTALTGVKALLMAQVALWVWPLVGCGMVRKTLPVMLVGSGVNVLVSVVGSVWWGTSGPALGSVVAYSLAYYPAFPVLLRREFGLPVWAVTRELPLAAVVFLPFAAALVWVSVLLSGVTSGSLLIDFFMWGGIAVAGGVAYLILGGWLFTTPGERATFLARFRRA